MQSLTQRVVALEKVVAGLVETDKAGRAWRSRIARQIDRGQGSFIFAELPKEPAAAVGVDDQAGRFMRCLCGHAEKAGNGSDDDMFFGSSEGRLVEIWKRAFGVKMSTTHVVRFFDQEHCLGADEGAA